MCPHRRFPCPRTDDAAFTRGVGLAFEIFSHEIELGWLQGLGVHSLEPGCVFLGHGCFHVDVVRDPDSERGHIPSKVDHRLSQRGDELVVFDVVLEIDDSLAVGEEQRLVNDVVP